MDDHQSPKGYGHLLPDPEDLAGILTELERKTAVGLTVSLPTTLLESSVSEYTSAQVPSRNQISSLAMKAPFFSSLVASTNSLYSFEQRRSDVISSQAPVSPFQTFTDMLSSGDELLWSEFQSNNCQDLYSNQSVSSLDLQKFEPYEDTRFELMGEEAEVATVPRLQSSHTGSFKEPIPYNWEATHAASTSKTFHGMSPSSSEPPGSASTPDSFMYPSSSEDSDDASNKDDGAACHKESKRMILAKPSDETTDIVESKKPTRKVQKKAIKRQRGPRYAIRTRSHVEVMDDGYRWRKYGQKAVKNSPFPRRFLWRGAHFSGIAFQI
ncbi:hypothetical protein O6H91_19G066000 [Diphasiastrum complanatum]|uniref:Uncharacterized protein n=1 Tax=Diphasiastrum complanatum TaxID=34168 RepID=A0ACC2AW28_DIPCM|nr:hypothetical protein O6H91_19G066000 [Diphasiastrum complanatum]